jgi:hypothetical protein
MRRFRLLLAVSVLLLAEESLPAMQSPEPWLPITPQDWQIKDVPMNPGAPAIQLYFSYYKDDNDKFISVYKRIKLLTEAATKPGGPADAEITIADGQSLKQLLARTVHPDGTIVELKDKPFEIVISKRRGIKQTVRKFTFPAVTIGSILEYSYLISLPPHVVDTISPWPLQGDLYTVKERFRFRAFQGFVIVSTEWDRLRRKSEVAYSYLNQADARVPQKKQGNLMELELENVAAFNSEPDMPPEDDYKPTVLFYYGGRETVSPDKFWEAWHKLIQEYVEKFIGNSEVVREAAVQAIGGETDPEKKLRKLYARAQQIRNLTYERERTVEEQKAEHLKENSSAQDVLQRGYGTAWDVDALFVALARSTGFEASMVGISDRQERSFTKYLLSLEQIGTRGVLVKVNGKNIVLDPGTPFCPYGMLRWQHTAATAFDFAPGGGFIATPDPDTSLARRTAKINVAADGSAKGEIAVEYLAQEALAHRLDALKTDEPGRRKNFEEEIQSWLPDGSVAKMVDSQGWETSDAPLTARFTVDIPHFASTTGKRLVAPSFLFPTPFKNTFNSSSRIYPYSFSYPFTESDQVTLILPDGYSMEVPPFRRKAGLSYASYEIASSLDGNTLVTKRSLRFDAFRFEQDKRVELKGFFDIVHAGDGGQAVLRASDAQEKTN